jgi:hypothetical protein
MLLLGRTALALVFNVERERDAAGKHLLTNNGRVREGA